MNENLALQHDMAKYHQTILMNCKIVERYRDSGNLTDEELNKSLDSIKRAVEDSKKRLDQHYLQVKEIKEIWSKLNPTKE